MSRGAHPSMSPQSCRYSHNICTHKDKHPTMPRQPRIVQRAVAWVRRRISSHTDEEDQHQAEEHLAEERGQSPHNLPLRTENRDEPANQGRGPMVYRFQILNPSEDIQRINRTLVLLIEENGVRFQLDMVQIFNDQVIWTITAGWPGQ